MEKKAKKEKDPLHYLGYLQNGIEVDDDLRRYPFAFAAGRRRWGRILCEQHPSIPQPNRPRKEKLISYITILVAKYN